MAHDSDVLGFQGLKSGDSLTIKEWSWVTLSARGAVVFMGQTGERARQQTFPVTPGGHVVLGYVAPGSTLHAYSKVTDVVVLGVSVQPIPAPK